MKSIFRSLLILSLLRPTSSLCWASDPTAERSRLGETAVKLSGSDPAQYQTCEVRPGQFSFTHQTEMNDSLLFAYGFNTSSKNQGSEKLSYTINIGSTQIFSATLNTQNKSDQGWHNIEIPLSKWTGKKIEISFSAKAEGAYDPLWGGVRVGDFKRTNSTLNVILISLDTFRADRISASGYPRATTPELDKLIKNGAYFEDAISVSPWTKPAHFSAFTGLFPSFHGMFRYDSKSKYKQKLPSKITLISEIFRNQGYLTQAFTGSGFLSAEYDFFHGFDRYTEAKVAFNSDGEFVFTQGIDWLKNHADKKFFLFLHTYEIHQPYRHSFFENGDESKPTKPIKFFSKEESIQHFNNNPEEIKRGILRYDSGVRYVDKLVGKLAAFLKESGLDKNTVVVVFSDHGEELMQHGYHMDHAHSLYDELLRVPLIFYSPSLIKPQWVKNFQAQQTDILPTLLDLCKIPYKKEDFQGLSLSSILLEQKVPPISFALSEATYDGPEKKSIRFVSEKDSYKYILAPDISSVAKKYPLLPTSIYKDLENNAQWNVFNRNADGREFYDLKSDVHEKKNLIGSKNSEIQILHNRLEDYILHIPLDRPALEDSAQTDEMRQESIEKLRSLGY